MVLSHRSKGILTLCGGVLIHLTLGTLYTFGNMSPYITSYLRYKTSETSLEYSTAMWIFSVQVMGHGLLMPFSGLIHNKIGSRWTTLTGATILSLGIFLTYFTIQKSFAAVVFTYGLLFGAAIGISYSVPISCAMMWFPSHKGLISGVILSGFGAGAFIFDQVQTAFINPDNLKANVSVGSQDEKYFDQHNVLKNVPNVFILLACAYAAMNFVGTLLLTKPKVKGEKTSVSSALIDSSGSESSESNNDVAHVKDKHPLVVIKTREFWTLWLMFLTNGQAVQFTSALYKSYGETFISNDRFLAIVGSFASVFNGLCRILWGYLADRISFKRTMVIQCLLMALLFLTFTLTEKAGDWMYFIWVCLMFGTFSGNFALFPTVTAKAFGQKYFISNYGLVFSSQIFAGVIAALLAQNLSDSLGWFGIFALVAGFSTLGLILNLSFHVKRPDGKDI